MEGERDSPPVGAGHEQPKCPLDKACQLQVINRDAMLVACVLKEEGVCPNRLLFGRGTFCRALLRSGVALFAGAVTVLFEAVCDRPAEWMWWV